MDDKVLQSAATLGSELEFLRPVEVADLVRIGNKADGGYIVPRTVLNQVDALVSFGVGFDWSVEEAVHALLPKIPIHSYDHTIGVPVFVRMRREALKALLKWPLRFIAGYSPWSDLRERYEDYRARRAWCPNYESFFMENRVHYSERVFNRKEHPSHVTVADVFARLTASESVFLKMDIEGDEYRIIKDILKYSDRIALLVIEFHGTEPYRATFLEHAMEICGRFDIVHLHGNNFGSVACDGLPEVLEITFARRELVPANRRRTQLPLDGLDCPNNPKQPDLVVQWLGTR
jgi:hypothetical protein